MNVTSKNIEAIIYEYVADHFGESEAEDPSWNIELLSEHLAAELTKE